MSKVIVNDVYCAQKISARWFYFLFILLTSMLSFEVRASSSVSAKTYKKLTEIQEMMGEGKSEEAHMELTTLLDNVDPDTLDQALTLQTLGYVEMARERFPEAITHLKASLALNVLPEKVVFNVGYMVAQLHAALGQYDEALSFAEGWFQQLEAPKPSQYIFMANIYAQNKQFKASIPYAKWAISGSDAPKESWFQLLTANYFELEEFIDAAKTLEQTINLFPDNATYWEQLASVYVILENEAAALATLKIAFMQGLLKKETTFKSLVQLAIARGIPEQAARLLEAGFDKDVLPQDEEYLKMLAVAYASAKERDKAINAYEKMAQVTQSGDPWISISNLYVELGEYANAEKSLVNALDAKLEEPGKAWLMLGIAQAEQQKFSEAKKSLKKSKAFDETERPAARWLKYTEDMKRQADWVAQYK